MARRYANIKKHRHSDGTVLDSKRELNRYCELLLLQRAGEISGLEVHPRVPIKIGGVKVRYPSGRQMASYPDFRYLDVNTQEWIVEDVKMGSGFRPEVYRIKKALLLAMGIEIKEVV